MSDKHRSVAVIVTVHAFEKETEMAAIMGVIDQYTGLASAILLKEGARGLVKAKTLAVQPTTVMDNDTLGEMVYVCSSAAMSAVCKALHDKYGWEDYKVKSEQEFMLAALETGEETH